jgi:hypothetical protein
MIATATVMAMALRLISSFLIQLTDPMTPPNIAYSFIRKDNNNNNMPMSKRG